MNIEKLLKGLNNAAKIIHKGNKKRGFWENPLPFASLIMLCVTELSEAIEADRKNNKANIVDFYDTLNNYPPECYEQSFKYEFEEYIKNTIEDELADTFIRMLDICAYYKIDIEKHIDLKVKYNNTRPKLHGKKY